MALSLKTVLASVALLFAPVDASNGFGEGRVKKFLALNPSPPPAAAPLLSGICETASIQDYRIRVPFVPDVDAFCRSLKVDSTRGAEEVCVFRIKGILQDADDKPGDSLCVQQPETKSRALREKYDTFFPHKGTSRIRYHFSRAENLESILKYGLRASNPALNDGTSPTTATKSGLDIGATPAVIGTTNKIFLSTSRYLAQEYILNTVLRGGRLDDWKGVVLFEIELPEETEEHLDPATGGVWYSLYVSRQKENYGKKVKDQHDGGKSPIKSGGNEEGYATFVLHDNIGPEYIRKYDPDAHLHVDGSPKWTNAHLRPDSSPERTDASSANGSGTSVDDPTSSSNSKENSSCCVVAVLVGVAIVIVAVLVLVYCLSAGIRVGGREYE